MISIAKLRLTVSANERQVRGTNLKFTTGAFARPRRYNTLPTRLRQAASRATFCSELRTHFLANVNSQSRSLCHRPSLCLSVVCNVRAPYSGNWNFRQCFYAIWYHAWPPFDIQVKFYGDRPRVTASLGELNTRGVAEYSDFGPIERYISEMAQDRR